jgi:hypothetical protein
MQYMPGQVKVTVQLHRSSDAFSLLADTKAMSESKRLNINQYYVSCRDLNLSFKSIWLTEMGIRSVAKSIERPLYFTFPSTHLASVNIPPGVLDYEGTVGSLHNLPSRTFVGLVPTSNLHGSYSTNSLFFKNYNINELTLKLSGMCMDTVKIPRWDINNTVDVYWKLLYALKVTGKAGCLDIDQETFINGPLTFLPLMGGPDLYYSDFSFAPGQLSLKFKFNEAVPAGGLTAIMFCIVQSSMCIDNGILTVNDVVDY